MAEYLGLQFFPAFMHLHWPGKAPQPQKEDELTDDEKEVARSLGNLLFCYPRRGTLTEDYPGLADAITHTLSEQWAPQRRALFLAERILVYFIEQLSADERASVAQQFREITMGQLAAAIQDQRDGKSKSSGDVAAGTMMIGWAFNVARLFVDKQQIQQSQYDEFRLQVLGALEDR
jgi:hypothetical protein